MAFPSHWSVTFGLGDASARLGPSLEQWSGDKSNEGELERDEVVRLGTEGDPSEQAEPVTGLGDSAEPQNLWNPSDCFERPDSGTPARTWTQG